MLSKNTFVKLIKENKVQVKVPLKNINKGDFKKPEKVWCTIKPTIINSIAYKVFTNPIDNNHYGIEWYTSYLLGFINSGFAEAKIIL